MAATTGARRPRPTRADLIDVESVLAGGVRRGTSEGVLAVHASDYLWVPERSIDLVLTDPPFNIARDTSFHTYENNSINSYRFDQDKGWDSHSSETFVGMLHGWSAEFARVLRPGGSFAVFCADDYVSHLKEGLAAAGLNPRRTLTWRKPNAVPINRKTMMMSACEYVVVGVKGSKATFRADLRCDDIEDVSDIEQVLVADKAASVVEKSVREAVGRVDVTGSSRPKAVEDAVAAAVAAAAEEVSDRIRRMYVTDDGDPYLRGCVPNHVSYNSKTGTRLHPTEKPAALLRYLIQPLSRQGDVVLDPFGGSGSTAEAARGLGRSVITVEQDQEFYESIVGRLELSDGQGS